jgi:hypothetical protein
MAQGLFARLMHATERGAFPGLRRTLWKGAYTTLSGVWRQPRWRFMNYDYLPPGASFELDPADKPERPFIGLYHQAIEGLPLAEAEVCEVGSGHGGGQGARPAPGRARPRVPHRRRRGAAIAGCQLRRRGEHRILALLRPD